MRGLCGASSRASRCQGKDGQVVNGNKGVSHLEHVLARYTLLQRSFVAPVLLDQRDLRVLFPDAGYEGAKAVKRKWAKRRAEMADGAR